MDTRAIVPILNVNQLSPWVYTASYPGQPGQVRKARAFLASVLDEFPLADDMVLLGSELCANAVLHSGSKKPGGTFAIRAEVREGESVRIEVSDQGGPWAERGRRRSGSHGLDLVKAIADGWGIEGDARTGWVVWFLMAWPATAADGPDPGRPPPLPRVPGSCQRHGAARPASHRRETART